MDLDNRIALITGGTGALGSAIALDFLASGARVAVTYTKEEEWQALRNRAAGQQARIESIRVDLTNAAETHGAAASLLRRLGRVDVLIAAAGGFAAGKSYETDDRGWNRMLDLNLRTLLNILRPVAPSMIEQKSGHIVTISSAAILDNPGAGIAAYAISKGAVRQLSEILAEELKDYGVRVHCIMPGTMDTEANRRAMPKADFSKWVKTTKVAAVIHQMVIGREGDSRLVVVPVLA